MSTLLRHHLMSRTQPAYLCFLCLTRLDYAALRRELKIYFSNALKISKPRPINPTSLAETGTARKRDTQSRAMSDCKTL